jgi:hypothetical protein
MAPPLHSSPDMTAFTSLDHAQLAHACGGQSTTTPQSVSRPPTRSWSQLGAEYSSACIHGAKDALMFGGRPQNKRDVAVTAGIGCAMGLAAKGAEDVAARL